MYTVKSSLQRFFYRDERNFRMHFSLEDFIERYCSDDQPDGNPFRNRALFDTDVQDWMQDLYLTSAHKVVQKFGQQHQQTKQLKSNLIATVYLKG